MKRVIALFALVAAAALHTSAADAVSPVRIRAASYNIRTGSDSSSESDSNNNWAKRKADLSNLVKEISPDVIGFQEVQYEQLTYFENQLSDYEFVGAFREGGTRSEATPVAFLTRRFKLLRSETFWLSATPDVVGSKVWGNGIEDSGYPRICTWTLLKDKSSGGVFLFVSTHLDLKDGPRLAGMRLILSRLAMFAALDVPIILVGDMNALETEDSMVEATHILQDALLVSETPPTGPWRTLSGFSWKEEEISCVDALANYTAEERSANANTSTFGKRIDYVFTSSNIIVETFATRNDARPGKNYYPSDHYPVVADLAVPCIDNLSRYSWLCECALKESLTGAWARDVAYDFDGRAYLYNNEFTPYVSSTGNVVIVEATMQFCEDVEGKTPDNTAQTAVRLSTNGCFQVWTHLRQGYGGQAGWVDVEADGVTPVSGAEYTLRFTFNYSNGTYSVDLKDNDRWIPLNSSTPNDSTTSFLIATATNCVSSISFVGDTLFTSLSGECRMVVSGFAQNETVVLKDNAVAILDAAKAAWLNKCAGGDKAAAGSAAANVSSKEFEEAYLLNLDIADGERSYSFAIADVKVGDENVTVSVTLKRTGIAGGEAAPINGTLKFYGAATLEAFKNAGSAAIEAANLTDGDFSKSDTATATFPVGENKFFKAKIEE